MLYNHSWYLTCASMQHMVVDSEEHAMLECSAHPFFKAPSSISHGCNQGPLVACKFLWGCLYCNKHVFCELTMSGI